MKKNIVYFIIFIAFMVSSFAVKVYLEGKREYNMAEEILERARENGETKEWEEAINHYQRAIHWYIPGADYVKDSIEKLWEIGGLMEERRRERGERRGTEEEDGKMRRWEDERANVRYREGRGERDEGRREKIEGDEGRGTRDEGRRTKDEGRMEENEEINLALMAYRELRASLYGIRSTYTPFREWIDRCDRKISNIVSMEGGKGRNGVSAKRRVGETANSELRTPNSELERKKNYQVLKKDYAPDVFWSILLEIGFLGWIGATIGMILMGFKGDRYDLKIIAFWGVVLIVFYCLWVIGLLKA